MRNIHGGNIYGLDGIIDFSANINPLGIPESVKAAVAMQLDNLMNYPDVFCENLRKRIGKFYDVPKEQIICGNGAADLIYRFVFAVKPKNALVPAPSFGEYERALIACDCNKILYYNINHKNFCVDDEILNFLTEDLDVLFLCNPNNPTGIIISEPLLKNILKRCREKNIFVLLDECFLDFTDYEKDFSYIRKHNDFYNLFLLKSFTKMYAMAGLRLGFGICANLKLIESMYMSGPPWNVSSVAQSAGIAALEEKNFPKITRDYIKKEKKYIFDVLGNLEISFVKGEANYIFFKSYENLSKKMFEKCILIRDCANYKNLTKGYFRIAVKTREENEKFIMTLKEIYKRQDL